MRLPLLLAGLCLAGTASAARADVADYLGRVVVSVGFEAEGRPLADPRIAEAIQNHVGQPLLMREVRESLVHLLSLGRFEDVVVRASHGARRRGALVRSGSSASHRTGVVFGRGRSRGG